MRRDSILSLSVAVLVGCFTMEKTAQAQSTVTPVVSFSLEDVTEMFMPPELYVDIDFTDDNGNQILEAKEKGMIILTLKNRGGKADNVVVSVLPDRTYDGISFTKQSETTKVLSNGETSLNFPIAAEINVPTDSVRLNIKVSEPLGFDIEAALVLSTYEMQKAQLKIQGVEILDSGVGLRALNNNPDGKVQKGEVVKAIVTLQNIGSGEASNVTYSLYSPDQNILLMTESGTEKILTGKLDTMLSGEAKELSFRFSPNNNFQLKDNYIPIYLTAREDNAFGDIPEKIIPIPLGATPEKPKIVDIKGNQDLLLAQQKTKVYSSSDRISSNIKIRDISIAPDGSPLYPDAVAIVIGAEKNNYGVAPAPYAARDAQVMAKYFRTSLGVKDVQLAVNENVLSTTMSDYFDPRFGHLAQVVKPGKTDVFVFYSGHGIPDVAEDGSQDVFLFPFDARKEMVRDRGYSLNKLYSDLNSLNARSVTVILDACFSGFSRQSAAYESKNISNTKGVRISMPEMSSRPWDSNPDFHVFTSSSGDQTSLGYDQSQSGLFTYFLAVGLQGDADADNDGKITMNELVKFVSQNVSEEATKIRGGAQTPQYFGNGDFVIEKLK